LRREGYDVATVCSGGAALAATSAQAFDLLLVDLRLPDMLGTDLIRAVNAQTAMPFVLMSAFLTTEITVEAMRLGAADVVEKPLMIETLCGMTSSLLRNAPVKTVHVADAIYGAAPIAASDPRPASTADRWAHY